MDTTVSVPDPGNFHHPLQNGHAPGLVTDNLHPYNPACENAAGDILDNTDLPGDGGILPLAPADVAEVLAAPGPELDPDLVGQQTRILEAELRAELDLLDRNHAAGLLPGFETLTGADLLRARLGLGNQVADQPGHCPTWCGYADLPIHGDGFDTIPDADVPHRGVPHDIRVQHGGEGIDHGGSAEITLQAEQHRDCQAKPVITLAVVVGDVEQYAWLTTAEARALHRTLDQLLDDTTGNG